MCAQGTVPPEVIVIPTPRLWYIYIYGIGHQTNIFLVILTTCIHRITSTDDNEDY